MALTILDDAMISDRTMHSACLTPGEAHMWEVSWLPGQYLCRDNAITAMVLADVVGAGDMHAGHRLWGHVESWAAELGMTGSDVLAQTAAPYGSTKAGKSAVPDDPEAAG
jgi:hypothetical protein